MIPTAEEFMDNQGLTVKQLQNLPWFDYGNLITWLEEYSIIKAKLHVEAALKAAFLNSEMRVSENDTSEYPSFTNNYDDGYVTITVNADSILNAYSLENIK